MASKSKTRNAVGYVRISRDREGETSTETQQRAIEAYCVTRGWRLVDVVVEPGRSAYKASRTSRPGFHKAMDHVTTGAADAFVVWKVDRAARNTLDLLRFVEELGEHGGEFASVTEQMDTTTPQGEIMLTLVAALAQLESAQKSDRAAEWHRHRRRTGAIPAGPAAFGYTKPAPNELVPDPKVAPLVVDAAERIAAGDSVLSVVNRLNAAGVKITHRGLTTALQSPTLVGMVAVSEDVLPRRGGARVLDGVELVAGSWEPIMTMETWRSVRAILGRPDRRTSSNNRLKHPLVPIARCHCGSKMRYHVEKWSTKTGPRSMGRLQCLDQSCLTGIGYDAVEEAVTVALLALLDPDAWNALRAATAADPGAHAAAVTERLTRMWAMVLDGLIEPEEYAEAKARWAGETPSTTERYELPDVDDLDAAWPDLEPEERLLVFRSTIEHLTIGKATRRGGRGVDLDRLDLRWRV